MRTEQSISILTISRSINILKGQAASALYGIRASNGVIVITTKSGKGAKKGKPQVSFSSNLSFDKISKKTSSSEHITASR